MDFADSIHLTKVILLAALLLFCSITDISVRRIPNAVLLPALMTSLFLSSLAGGLAGLADSLAGLAVGLLMLLPMHLLGRMGAGDIKLLGVVGSILGAWGALVVGLATMMAGGVLAVLYALWIFTKPVVQWRLSRMLGYVTGKPVASGAEPTLLTVRAAEIPYAVAIAVGAFAALTYLDLLPEVGMT